MPFRVSTVVLPVIKDSATMSVSILRGLARTALQAKSALPARAGAGAPVKLAPRPDKPVS